jgi:hypothetical protein
MATKGIIIEVKGLEELQRKMKSFNAEKLKQTEQGVKNAGYFVQREVVFSINGERAEPRSVDTGRFKGSVKAIFPAPYTATVETNVEYAPDLEYGTTKMAPRSHFRNTADRNKNKVKEIIKAEISKI